MMKRSARGWLAAAILLTGLAGGLARADEFDGRNPQDGLSVVTHNGASAEVKKDKGGRVYLDGQTGQLFFQGDYYDCDNKAACKVFLLTSLWDTTDVTVDQINSWNRWTVSCPAYLDADGSPNVWSSTTIYKTQTREQFTDNFKHFQSCLSDFSDFVEDPDAFLTKNLDGYAAPAKPAGATPKAEAQKL